MRARRSYCIYMLTVIVLTGCLSADRADITGVDVTLELKRFEKSLFTLGNTIKAEDLRMLKSDYGEFVDIFTHNIMSMGEGSDSLIAENLTFFTNDSMVRVVNAHVETEFADTNWLKDELVDFFKHYKYFFPEKKLPFVTTYVSSFEYGIITSDTILGIGLDMFLGKGYEYYPMIGAPKYMYDRFSKEYIVPGCIKAIYQLDYDPQLVKNELLSQMIYQGKMLYFIEQKKVNRA